MSGGRASRGGRQTSNQRPEGRGAPARPPEQGRGLRSPIVVTTLLALLAGGVVVLVAMIGGLTPAGSSPTTAPGAAASGASGAGSSSGAGTSSGPGSSTVEVVVPLIAPPAPAPNNLANGLTLGSADAPVTLVVWSDFQCPSCAAFTREVQPKVVQEFVMPGRVKITYRDFSFIGPESVDAAIAARCAADQGKFWPYHDYLFWNQKAENSGGFARATLDAIGRTVGLQMTVFDSCLGLPAGAAAVQADTAAAQQAGVKVTPTLQVGATMMPGVPLTDAQYNVLRQVIQRGG